ncbi:MAG TPA: universal stress protein [Acidimicrobiales bacterium]|nr:universal stress protein [Acidimicrobiales bacterium]
MVERLIVPLDGSEHAARALSVALEIRRRTDARIVVVRSAHPADADAARAEIHAELGAVGLVDDRGAAVHDVEVVVDVDRGAVGAIASAASGEPGTLVCMSTHGRGGVGRAVLGSVAEEALVDAGVPFVLVGPHHQTGPLAGPVLLAIDGSLRSESVVPLAAEWSRRLGAELWVVSVIDPRDAAAARAALGGDHVDEGAHVHRVASALSAELGRAIDWEVLHDDDPAAALVRYAADKGASVVVMATHGRTGLARVTMGSVTARVVRDHSGVVLVARSADGAND